MKPNALKGLLRPAVHAVREPVDRMLASRMSPLDLWRRRKSSELNFWENWIQTQGREWGREEWSARLSGEAVIVGRIAELVDRVPGSVVSILDVGAGPATTLGKRHPAKQLSITAIDPLADDYRRLWSEAGISPPVETIYGTGEEVGERLPHSFDIAYARNALDHAYDPVKAIQGMLKVAKHFVLLEHKRNEAENARYRGMHNWNFDMRGGELVIWNLRERQNVADLLGLRPQVQLADDGWIAVTFDLRD